MRDLPTRGRLVGVRQLFAVALRQDAHAIAPWIALISVLSASSVLIYGWVFPDEASRRVLEVSVAGNPALGLIFGRAWDLSTADGFNAWRAGSLGAFFAALMAIFVVVRNSRADEDTGRAELLASGVLGREARLAVAVAVAFAASTALGVVAAVVTMLFGGDPAASALLAATFTVSGFMFAGVAAVAAQVGSDARSANSIAVATLGVLFVARGYVDASGAPDWAVWLTPLGWLLQTRPASENLWWPLVPAVGLALALVGVALHLHGRRDFGMGLVAPRAGPARAGAVGSAWGLALRLNRSALVSWMLAFALLGVIWGFLASTVGEVILDNPMLAQVLAAGVVTEDDLRFEFVVTVVRLIGIIAAVQGVQVVMRISAEESDDRVEPLLAGALRRRTYLASNAVVASGATAVAMLVGGSVTGVVAAANDEAIAASDVLRQAAATIPGVWVLVALALAVVGAHPARRIIGWMGVVATFALTILGPLFNLDDWVLGISPLWHVPNVAAAAPDWSGLGWLALVAAALTAVGFVGFARRDVGAGAAHHA